MTFSHVPTAILLFLPIVYEIIDEISTTSPCCESYGGTIGTEFMDVPKKQQGQGEIRNWILIYAGCYFHKVTAFYTAVECVDLKREY